MTARTSEEAGRMRAAVFHGAGDVRVESVPAPSPAPGQALLRVRRTGICGTDATEFRAGPILFPVTRPNPISGHVGPFVFGHEFVGEIVELPEEAAGLAVGDLVASGAGVSCGECARCREGRTNLCVRYATHGLNLPGGLAEYVAVDVRTLVKVPDGLDLDSAGLAQPLAVGLHAVDRSRARAGDRVLLFGAGAIGTFILAGLVARDGIDVTVVDFGGPRLGRAVRLGARTTVAVDDGSDDTLRELAGPLGFDVVIEATGAPGRMNAALGLVRPGGTLLQVGLPSAEQELDVHHLVMAEITVETTLAHVCDHDLAPALAVLADGRLRDELLEGVHALDEVPEQLARLARGEIAGKVLFDPTRLPAA